MQHEMQLHTTSSAQEPQWKCDMVACSCSSANRGGPQPHLRILRLHATALNSVPNKWIHRSNQSWFISECDHCHACANSLLGQPFTDDRSLQQHGGEDSAEAAGSPNSSEKGHRALHSVWLQSFGPCHRQPRLRHGKTPQKQGGEG